MKNIRGMEALYIKIPTFNLEENWCRNMLEFRVTMFSQDGGTSVFLCHSTKCLIKHSTKDTPFNWRQGIDGGLNQPLILEGSDLLAQYTSESLPRYPTHTHTVSPAMEKEPQAQSFSFSQVQKITQLLLIIYHMILSFPCFGLDGRCRHFQTTNDTAIYYAIKKITR